MSETFALLTNPIIHYPRVAQIGKTYLLTIELEEREETAWQYDEEEYFIYCSVSSELFDRESVGEPILAIHRFGGSYDKAKFLLTAVREGTGKIHVMLSNQWGSLIENIELEYIYVNNKFIESNKTQETHQSTDQDNNEEENDGNTLWDRMPGWDENDTWEKPSENYLSWGYSSPKDVFRDTKDEARKEDVVQEDSENKHTSLNNIQKPLKQFLRPTKEEMAKLWNKIPDWDE